jgi:tetratricopeptide (TPR) repeat protein
VIRGIGLHRRALDALERSGASDHARMAYHAESAADGARVLAHARPAADVATRTGAYREAIEQLERAQRFADLLPDAERADMLEALSYVLSMVSRQREAYDARVKALELRCRVGDPLREGDCLRWLSRIAWIRGLAGEDEEHGLAALRLLEPLGDTHELRMAISNLAGLYMIQQRTDEAMAMGQRALETGLREDDHEVVAHALNNVGSTRLNLGDPGGQAMLIESAAISRETACRSISTAPCSTSPPAHLPGATWRRRSGRSANSSSGRAVRSWSVAASKRHWPR